MHNLTLTTSELASTMGMSTEPVHQMLSRREFAGIRPDKAFAGKSCLFNPQRAFLMLIAGDLVRWGIKSPLAGKIAARAAECLLFDATADFLHIQFHANGASFIFTADPAPDAASAAGPARFRITFDLRAYRAAVDAAMSKAR